MKKYVVFTKERGEEDLRPALYTNQQWLARLYFFLLTKGLRQHTILAMNIQK